MRSCGWFGWFVGVGVVVVVELVRENEREKKEVEFFLFFFFGIDQNQRPLYHASRQRVCPRRIEGDAEDGALVPLEHARGVGGQSMGVRVAGYRAHCELVEDEKEEWRIECSSRCALFTFFADDVRWLDFFFFLHRAFFLSSSFFLRNERRSSFAFPRTRSRGPSLFP